MFVKQLLTDVYVLALYDKVNKHVLNRKSCIDNTQLSQCLASIADSIGKSPLPAAEKVKYCSEIFKILH